MDKESFNRRVYAMSIICLIPMKKTVELVNIKTEEHLNIT